MVFAGLMFSQGNQVSNSGHALRNQPLVNTSISRDETEHFEQVYPLNANGRLAISNVNGSIVVDSWDRNEVKVEYTKTGDSKERLADVQVRIDPRPDYMRIETDYGDWRGDRGSRHNTKLQIDFHITAPRGAVLNEVETVNGSVTVSNFSNFTKISAVNGGVSAVNLRGTANLSTVNGEVSADFDRLDTGSKINLNTVNGTARVVIPSDSNATFKVDSLNGNITNDFGLPVRKGKYVGRDLYGKIGSGDVSVRMSSVNGALTISRKNDGKTPSPATNLLPQKKADDDWDNDNDDDSMVDSDKMNKSIDKSMKDLDKQVKKMQPAIEKAAAESAERAARSIDDTAVIIQSEDLKEKVRELAEKQAEFARMAPVAFMSVPRVEEKSGTVAVKGVSTVTVEARGCSVDVKGWDKSEVRYRVVQFADPRRTVPVNVTENHTDSAVNINIEYTEPRRPNGQPVRVEVYVPRHSNLKIDTDSAIRLDGVSGDIELKGSEESINVRDADGTMRVSTSDGRIRVIGFKGDIVANSSDGMINLEGDFKNLTANASDGDVTLTVPENTNANLEAGCSDVHGDGIALTKTGGDEPVCRYRIGSGGPQFQVHTNGEVLVRSLGLLAVR